MSETQHIERLYAVHREALIGYARSILHSQHAAEDVVQEAYIRFLRAKRDLLTPEAELSYLYRIVRNLAFDLIRRRRIEISHQSGDVPSWGLPAEEMSPEQNVLLEEQRRLISAILHGLPEDVRNSLELYRFGGLKLNEIAVRLGLSPSTVHRHIQKAMAEISKQLFSDPDNKKHVKGEKS